jgi:hypothetical protein
LAALGRNLQSGRPGADIDARTFDVGRRRRRRCRLRNARLGAGEKVGKPVTDRGDVSDEPMLDAKEQPDSSMAPISSVNARAPPRIACRHAPDALK